MRLSITLTLATALTTSMALAEAPGEQQPADAPLEQQFREPPDRTRPRV